RIVIARKADGSRKGNWLFTRETVSLVGRMFLAVRDRPIHEASDGTLRPPRFWHEPALWVRFQMPESLQVSFWRLQLYRWLGIGCAVLVSIVLPRLLMPQVQRLVALILRRSGSALSQPFVAAKLRPLTWVAACWLLFRMLALL